MSDFILKDGISKAYGLYALSVIKGRALPDIKDGLKPVQRRILYSMYESGYRYNKPFKKSARIVGEVLGKYHPHGDSSVYGAVVNLVQDFGMSLPLIQGQGNFGSIDGDNAASMRYTEARLAQISEYMLADYDKNTVPMTYNYDGTLEVPTLLPVQFPNLLVNGANGIAVGMATSIPCHNLKEVMNALIAMLENEDISLTQLLQHIKGPDFPTGGAFFGGKDMLSGYENGRGKVILRGTLFEEQVKNKTLIIIDSIPYQISKPKLIESITNLIENDNLDISDVRDESGRNIRIVLELKKDANAEVIKQRLFSQTQLQVSISYNMVAINEDRPILFNLKQALQIFLRFREEVVIKRAEFILQKTLDKAHIVAGLVLATGLIDLIIKTIKSAKDATQAKEFLMAIEWQAHHFSSILNILGSDYIISETYFLSELQAKAILELRLQKLTMLEKDSLIIDLTELAAIIKEQKEIIQNRDYRKNLMKEEFNVVSEKFGVDRRTAILSSIDGVTEESLIPQEDLVIMLTSNGYIKRISQEEYKVQHRGGKGKIGHKKIEDPILNFFNTNTHTEILFFTNFGKVFSLKGYEIPEGSANSKGRAAINLFKLDPKEQITTILPIDKKNENIGELNLSHDKEFYLMFVTANGTIRRNALKDFENIRANGKIAMKLEEGNYLHSVLLVYDDMDLLLTSSNGNSIKFAASDIRVFESRSSQGVKAITLNDDDKIIGAQAIEANSQLLCITENGFGKRSDIDEYRKIKRGGKGVKTMNINAKTGKLVQVVNLQKDSDVLLMTKNGQTIRLHAADIRKTSRVASGVILMRLPENDKVQIAISIEAEKED